MEGILDTKKLVLRRYLPGEEIKLVNFLQSCYRGKWGDINYWKWLNIFDPSFNPKNIFVYEYGPDIVGYRSLHYQRLIIYGETVMVSFYGSTATNPDYRKLKVYSRQHMATLEEAKLMNCSLVFTLNAKGSITYKHNKKTGFIEIKRSPKYIKILNYDLYFKNELYAYISNRPDLIKLLQKFNIDISIHFRNNNYTLSEICEKCEIDTLSIKNDEKVGIKLADNSLPVLIEFLTGSKFQKTKCILIMLIKRLIKIKFSSPKVVVRIIREVVGIV